MVAPLIQSLDRRSRRRWYVPARRLVEGSAGDLSTKLILIRLMFLHIVWGQVVVPSHVRSRRGCNVLLMMGANLVGFVLGVYDVRYLHTS